VGIGGNDAGLIGVVEKCAELDLLNLGFGSPCEDKYNDHGNDPNIAAINATAPKVAEVIQDIHELAPSAKVLVVGYPDGLPVDGSNCFPAVPLTSGDIEYFNMLEKLLNSKLASDAANNGATYVDTFPSFIGHDACKGSGTAWVNGTIPNSAALPLHPNASGEEDMADQVLAALV
jgi:lysophospholipase L1-like esterase